MKRSSDPTSATRRQGPNPRRLGHPHPLGLALLLTGAMLLGGAWLLQPSLQGPGSNVAAEGPHAGAAPPSLGRVHTSLTASGVTGLGNITTVPYPWGLAIDPATHRAFVTGAANAPSGEISAVDLSSRSTLFTAPVGGNGEARDSWFDPATNALWVPYLDSDLGTFDGASGALLQNVQVGASGTQAAPYAVAYDPSTNHLWVTDFFNSELSVVDRSSDQVVATVSTGAGSWPYWIVIDPSTQLAFVTDTGANVLHVVNTSTDTLVSNLPVNDLTYSSEALDPVHHLVYVSGSSGSTLTVVQENPLKVLTTVATVGQVFGVAVDPTLNLLAATGFSDQGELYCASTLAPVASLPYAVPGPYGLGFDPTLSLLAVDLNPSSGPGQLGLFDVSGAASACSGAPPPPPPPPPSLVATASASPAQGPAPLGVSFTGSASGGSPPYAYGWSFGDGTSSALQDPSHTYSTAGTYSAVLTVTDSSGQTAQALPSVISVSSENRTSQLGLSISLSSIQGPAPLTVGLTATPSGGTPPYAVHWTFGDGSSATGLLVSHTYTVPGSYQLFASVTDANGSIAAISPVPVTIDTSNGTGGGDVPLAVAAAETSTSGTAPLNVGFAAVVTGGTPPYTLVWSFGDSTSGLGETPSHVYTAAGTYAAQVTVTDAAGHSVLSTLPSVQVARATAPADATLSSTTAGPALPLGVGTAAGVGAGLGFPLLANRRAGGALRPSRFSAWRRT